MSQPAAPEGEDRADDFPALDRLRLLLEDLLASAKPSLEQYRDVPSGGWFHLTPAVVAKPPGDYSRASTATCVALVRTAGFDWLDASAAQQLADSIITGEWDSADLGENNAFTVAYLLDALRDLEQLGAVLSREQRAVVKAKLQILIKSFDHDSVEDDGGVGAPNYPPTAFLTYKAVHALLAWEQLGARLAARVSRWATAALHAESVLVASGSDDADVFELAYAALTVATAVRLDDMTPPQRDVLDFAMRQFFTHQRPDGTWPRSRPLFHYPRHGDAYCFDYELLGALLGNTQLRSILSRNMEALRNAALALERRRFPLKGGGFGWSSGHLRHYKSAESWSTAAVYHFCYELDRLVAEDLRRLVFEDLGEKLLVPEDPPRATLGGGYVDSWVEQAGKQASLTEILEQDFLAPLVGSVSQVDKGQPLPKGVKRSAILYGPPGTSKTELAKLVAIALKWPLLKIDPSHLTRGGLENVHAEANRLFGMLGSIERVVVLLDEFDELVREREGPNEVLSRFLTTAMLPKLTALSDRRRLVLLLATNHVESFDSAIRRPGRFDMVLPVMPPSLPAKLAHERFEPVQRHLKKLKVDLALAKFSQLAEQLEDLTYLEFEAAIPSIATAPTITALRDKVQAAWSGCTLAQPLQVATSSGGVGKETWRDRIRSQEDKIRPQLPDD